MKLIYPKNYSPSRNSIITDYCKDKKVLHIWACDSPFTKEKFDWSMWPLLYREIDKVCNEQLWIDLDQDSINYLNDNWSDFPNSQIKYFDMNKLEDLDYIPDVIIFWEVIEHLMNLEIALTNLKKVMWKNTSIIISTPNSTAFHIFMNSLFWFEYIHEDHKIAFTYGTLKTLLSFNSIEIKKFFFTKLDRWSSQKNICWHLIWLFWKIINKFFIWTNETLLVIWKIK